MNNLEQRTQVPKAYAAIGSIVLLGFLLLVNSFASPVSNLIGWGLPAYLSFKAIESPGVQDDVQWLTYWVVFGFFNFLESFALRAVLYYFPVVIYPNSLLFIFSIIPYHFLKKKLVFLIHTKFMLLFYFQDERSNSGFPSR